MSKDTNVEVLEDISNEELVQEELVDDAQVIDEDVLEEGKHKAEEEGVEIEIDGDEDEDEEEEETPAPKMEMPKTKAGVIQAAVEMLKKAKKEDAQSMFAKMTKVEESTVEEGDVQISHIDYSEDLDILVNEEATLSEGFRLKASTIFEAALKSKVSAEIDRLEAEYSQNLEEEVTEFQSSLVEKVDSYLNYVVENWMKDNEVAVVSGLKTEIAEGFITSLQAVFKEHYIEVPEGKTDLIEELADQVAELEESLNKSTEDNIRLHEANQAHAKKEIIRNASSGLSESEAEKLQSFVEDIDFDNAETFEMKVKVIKESYFSQKNEPVDEANSLIGEDTAPAVALSEVMARYTQAITNNLKK
jgi:hypothetical protein